MHRVRRILLREWLGLWLALLVGCAADRSQTDRALMREPNHPIPGAATRDYIVHCPDVLAISVAGRPDLSGSKIIGTDGRVELGTLGRLRVEGKDVADLELLVAQVACI